MKIVHLTTVHPRNDTRVFERIAKSVSLAYKKSLIFYVYDGQGSEEKDGICIRSMGKANSKSRIFRFLGGWAKSVQMLFQERPDVLHFHDPELLFVAPVARLLGCKVVYDVHEELSEQIKGKPWLPRWLRMPLSYFFAKVEQMLCFSVSAICAATPKIKRNFPDEKTWLVQNYPSFRENLFSPEKYYSDESPNVFFYVGGITKRRAIIEMMDAIAIVSQQHKVKLILAGRFSDKSFEEEVFGHEAWPFVEYLGWAGRDVVASAMKRALAGLVLCYPERNYLEAQPTKLYEYLWGGLKIIASDFPYWRKMVGDDIQGVFYVDPRDSSSVARAMINVIEEKGRSVSPKVLHDQAIERFSWENEERQLLRMYSSLLD